MHRLTTIALACALTVTLTPAANAAPWEDGKIQYGTNVSVGDTISTRTPGLFTSPKTRIDPGCPEGASCGDAAPANPPYVIASESISKWWNEGKQPFTLPRDIDTSTGTLNRAVVSFGPQEIYNQLSCSAPLQIGSRSDYTAAYTTTAWVEYTWTFWGQDFPKVGRKQVLDATGVIVTDPNTGQVLYDEVPYTVTERWFEAGGACGYENGASLQADQSVTQWAEYRLYGCYDQSGAAITDERNKREIPDLAEHSGANVGYIRGPLVTAIGAPALENYDQTQENKFERNNGALAKTVQLPAIEFYNRVLVDQPVQYVNPSREEAIKCFGRLREVGDAWASTYRTYQYPGITSGYPTKFAEMYPSLVSQEVRPGDTDASGYVPRKGRAYPMYIQATGMRQIRLWHEYAAFCNILDGDDVTRPILAYVQNGNFRSGFRYPSPDGKAGMVPASAIKGMNLPSGEGDVENFYSFRCAQGQTPDPNGGADLRTNDVLTCGDYREDVFRAYNLITVPYTYDRRGYTYTTRSRTETYQSGTETYQSGSRTETYTTNDSGAATWYWWVNGGRGGYACPSGWTLSGSTCHIVTTRYRTVPVWSTRPVYSTNTITWQEKNPPPAGYRDDGAGYVANNPNPCPSGWTGTATGCLGPADEGAGWVNDGSRWRKTLTNPVWTVRPDGSKVPAAPVVTNSTDPTMDKRWKGTRQEDGSLFAEFEASATGKAWRVPWQRVVIRDTRTGADINTTPGANPRWEEQWLLGPSGSPSWVGNPNCDGKDCPYGFWADDTPATSGDAPAPGTRYQPTSQGPVPGNNHSIRFDEWLPGRDEYGTLYARFAVPRTVGAPPLAVTYRARVTVDIPVEVTWPVFGASMSNLGVSGTTSYLDPAGATITQTYMCEAEPVTIDVLGVR